MPEPVLLVDKGEGIATLTLNRPDQMNALSAELRQALADELSRLADDRDVGVVILTGAGRAFCAGLDLKEAGATGLSSSSLADPPRLLRTLPQPVIGAINGFAITGGFEIALSCDLLIATPEASFADTHARVGVLPGWGLSQRLSRAIGLNRAKELSFTGNYLTAERAYDWGLVNRIVTRDELLPTCWALANDMLSCLPEVVFEYKRIIDRGFDLTLGDAMVYEAEVSRLHQPPSPEEIAARRPDVEQRGRRQAYERGGG